MWVCLEGKIKFFLCLNEFFSPFLVLGLGILVFSLYLCTFDAYFKVKIYEYTA